MNWYGLEFLAVMLIILGWVMVTLWIEADHDEPRSVTSSKNCSPPVYRLVKPVLYDFEELEMDAASQRLAVYGEQK